jgi:hypothetical protein
MYIFLGFAGELDMLEKGLDLMFLKEGIPLWAAGAGYVCLAQPFPLGLCPKFSHQ